MSPFHHGHSCHLVRVCGHNIEDLIAYDYLLPENKAIAKHLASLDNGGEKGERKITVTLTRGMHKKECQLLHSVLPCKIKDLEFISAVLPC